MSNSSQQLLNDEQLNVDRDARLSNISRSERNEADAELADLIRNAKTGKEVAALLDKQREIDSEPNKPHKDKRDSASSDAQNDSNIEAGPSLASTIALSATQIAGFAAFGLAPAAAMAAMDAARKYVNFANASENVPAQDTSQLNTTLAADRNPADTSRNKMEQAETILATADMKNAEDWQKSERRALEQEAADIATRAGGGAVTANDYRNIKNGIEALSDGEVQKAAADVKETTVKLLLEAPDNNPKLAQDVQENGHIPIPGALVINDIPIERGALLPSQSVGKAQPVARARGPVA